MKTQACIWLSPEDRATLEGWVADRNTPQKVVWRARIVLVSADGVGTMAIVRALGKTKRTVGRWQERYLARGHRGAEAGCNAAVPQAAAYGGDDQACGRDDAA